MRHRLLVTAACAATALTWITPATGGWAQTDPAPPPTITVTPDHDLVDGQPVLVEGAGFPPYDVAILQCRPGSTTLSDVIANCELKSSRLPDASGSFSLYQPVERAIQPMSGPGPVDCTSAPGACTLAVAYNFMQSVVEVPLTFADPDEPVPTITVTPSTGLDDGDVVAISGAGFTPGAEVTVAQCQNDRPIAAEWCDVRPAFAAIADATGAIAGELTVRRAITVGAGHVVDCVGTGCVVAASTGEGGPWARAAIALVDRNILAIAFGPHTVTPLGTVNITGSAVCSDPWEGALEVRGTITQTIDDRTVTAPFSAQTTCGFFTRWDAQVLGSRTQRFKTGPARITAWAYEVIDPFPDDASASTVDVELVRPER